MPGPVKSGHTIQAEVVDVRDNGLYLRAEGRDGFVNVTELGWAPGPVRPSAYARVGETIDVFVYAVTETGFHASLKALDPAGDPFRDLSVYEVGTVHRGTVRSVASWGVFVLLESGAVGRIATDQGSFGLSPGDRVQVAIVSFDPPTRRLELRFLPPETRVFDGRE